MPPNSVARALAPAAVLLAAAWLGACGPDGGEPARIVEQPLVSQCPSDAEEGIDVFDGQGTIDWRAVAGAGVRFAVIKATQGTYDTQATFAANWAGARAAGIVRGAYHFFDPTEDGAAQAAHFAIVVGPLAADDMAPVLDIECPDGDESCLYAGAPGTASAAEIHDRMWDFLREVARATGRVPVVYTFGSYFASNGVDATGLDDFPLFLAYPTEASCLGVPAPWSQAALWQYSWTGTVAGVARPVDRDRWIGWAASGTSSSSGSTERSSTASSAASLGVTSYAVGLASTGASAASFASTAQGSSAGAPPAADSKSSAGCAVPPGQRAPACPFALVLVCAGLCARRRRLPSRVGAC